MENECFKIPYIAPPSQPHNVGERPQYHGGENRECRTRVINIIFCETELTPRHSPNGLAMKPSAIALTSSTMTMSLKPEFWVG